MHIIFNCTVWHSMLWFTDHTPSNFKINKHQIMSKINDALKRYLPSGAA